MKHLVRMMKDESGATAIEYGLIAALIAVAAILAMNFLGSSLSNTFSGIGTQLNTATAVPGR